MSDPRCNLPSASSLERLDKCPGSWGLSQKCERATNQWAEIGDKVHRWLAGDKDVILEPEQLETAEGCERLTEEAVTAWMETTEGADVVETAPERLWLRDGLRPIFSGEFDRLYMAGNRALIIDFKTLWGKQPPSEGNLQLMAYAVLAKKRWPHLEHVSVVLIAPHSAKGIRICTYSPEDLATAENEILRIIAATKKPDAPLNPGDHCTYCPANAAVICQALQKEVVTLSATVLREENEQIDNATLGVLLDKCGALKKVVGNIEALAKRRISAGEKITHGEWEWVLTEGDDRRKVTDPAAALAALPIMTASEFIACCTVKISALEKAYHATRKASEPKILQKATKAELSGKLTKAGALEVKTNKESLERIALRIENTP